VNGKKKHWEKKTCSVRFWSSSAAFFPHLVFVPMPIRAFPKSLIPPTWFLVSMPFPGLPLSFGNLPILPCPSHNSQTICPPSIPLPVLFFRFHTLSSKFPSHFPFTSMPFPF
jgi:hypothetical protein